jgi:cobalt/nickel transport protein
MSFLKNKLRNRSLILVGLGFSLVVAVFLSPFASQDPDGLDRVAQDQKFEEKAAKDEEMVAKKLPFANIFAEYSLRGAPDAIATPLAGLLGTLTTFGIAWGVGKILIKGNLPDTPDIDGDTVLENKHSSQPSNQDDQSF